MTCDPHSPAETGTRPPDDCLGIQEQALGCRCWRAAGAELGRGVLL